MLDWEIRKIRINKADNVTIVLEQTDLGEFAVKAQFDGASEGINIMNFRYSQQWVCRSILDGLSDSDLLLLVANHHCGRNSKRSFDLD